MPIFEFECIVHGRFEVLLPRLPEDERHECPWRLVKPYYPLMKCVYQAPLVPSRVTMRPDPYWSGVMTDNYGYQTSASKVARIMKEKHHVEVGDRSDREAMRKTADEAAKAREDKFAKDTREFLNKQLSDAGVLDSFGGVRPEALKPVSSEPITRITKDDPRLK